jgi:hypothetical protein
MSTHRSKLQDSLTVLKTTGNRVLTSGWATVGATVNGVRSSTRGSVDTGGGWTNGTLVVEIASLSTSAFNATTSISRAISIQLRGCQHSTFASREVVLAQVDLGYPSSGTDCRVGGGWIPATMFTLGAVAVNTSAAGGNPFNSIVQIIKPFCNEWNNTTYRYMRLYHQIAGTWVTGVDYTAYLSDPL